MIKIGNFFFRYRNGLFIFLYLLLFIPSPALFSEAAFGVHFYYWPIIAGLIITITGQAVRGATIGLAYIVRGGRNKKVYADELVTGGLFSHCRNPLYLGNILMLLGVGVLSNSLIYVCVVMPAFVIIYQAIVLAEEDFLKRKFNDRFLEYCEQVNRWIPALKGLADTFRAMRFHWKRWLIKEYNTQYIWLTGIALLLLFKYPQLTSGDEVKRNTALAIILPLLLIYYLTIRYLKKTGKWSG